jgi:H+/Cl- antiporter ClcA
MLEVLGIIMVVQGVGGAINNVVGGQPSWFLVNHLPFLDGWELPASIVLAVVGGALALAGERARKARRA